MQFNILFWTSTCLVVSIISCNNLEMSNRRRRMTINQSNPSYSNEFVVDTSPFTSGYMSRIPKSISNLNYKSGFKTVIPRGFKDSQDFNVGYSLSLENGKNTNVKLPSTNNFAYGDIITGSPKQNTNLNYRNVQEIQKKYTNIELKNDDVVKMLSETNKTPQNFFSSLESNQNNKEWMNVSPNIEIFRSKEIPFNQQFSSNDLIQQNNHFDHQKALGRSQGFDYSNVIDGQFSDIKIPQETNFQFNSALKQPQTSFNHLSGTTVSLASPQQQTIDLTKFQTQDTNFDQQQQFDTKSFAQHMSFPQIEAAFQNTPKFPLDTHLLKEAGVNTDVKEKANGGIPVQIDTSMIDKFKPNTDLIKTSSFTQSLQQQQQAQFQFPKEQQLFTTRPQFQQPKPEFVNFQEQSMLHFDNANNNKQNQNLYGNIQKLHGFRKGTYNNNPNPSRKQNGLQKLKINYPVQNLNTKNQNLGSFGMNVELKPPPINRQRYRPKTKRYF